MLRRSILCITTLAVSMLIMQCSENEPAAFLQTAEGTGLLGKVVDENGSPVKDADLVVFRSNQDGSIEETDQTQTEPDGSFKIESIDPGSYDLAIVTDNAPVKLVPVTIGSNPVDVGDIAIDETGKSPLEMYAGDVACEEKVRLTIDRLEALCTEASAAHDYDLLTKLKLESEAFSSIAQDYCLHQTPVDPRVEPTPVLTECEQKMVEIENDYLPRLNILGGSGDTVAYNALMAEYINLHDPLARSCHPTYGDDAR